MKMKKDKQRGITLIVLVITVIIMLILAGIVISTIVGNDGLLEKIIKSAKTYNNSAENEAEVINYISTNEFFNGEKPGPIEVPNLTEENIMFLYTPSNWTNGNVELEITTTLKGYTLQYSLDNGVNWNNYTSKLKIQENNKIVLVRLEKRGTVSNIATGNVKNIDKIAPKIFTPTVADIKQTEFTMLANVEDEEETEISGKSGIGKYEFYVEGQLYGEVNSEDGNSIKIQDRINNTTYTNCYVIVYDKAGNYTESEHINIKTKSPDIPITDPEVTGGQHVEYEAGGYNQWRILTNDGTTVTLISVGSPKNQYLYGKDGGNNGLTYINNACQEYINSTFAASVRNAKKSDVNSMNSIGALITGEYYWLAERTTLNGNYGPVSIAIEWVSPSGQISKDGAVGNDQRWLWSYILDEISRGYTMGIRPIITLKPGVKIIDGEGTSTNKYILGI